MNNIQIENSKFGKSLLDTINLQMNMNQGVNNIIKVLDEMRDTMNHQKEFYEQEHQKYQQYCAKDIDFYQREIDESIVNVVDIQREIDKQSDEIAIIYQNLNSTEEQQKFYQKQLEKLNEVRMEQYKAFRNSMEEYDVTTTAIEQAKRYFVKIRGQVQFLQTKKNVLIQLTNHFKEAKIIVQSQKRKSLFHILAQITNKATENKEIVAKILELCNRVLENVQESRMEEEEEEQVRIRLFYEKKTQIEEKVAKLQKIIDNLTTQLTALKENLKINSQYKEEQTNRKQENQKLYDSRKNECDYEVKQYTDHREKVLNEISTIEEVITITETKLVVLKQYLTERKEKQNK